MFSTTTIYNKLEMLGINTQEQDIFTEFRLEINSPHVVEQYRYGSLSML